MKSIFTGLAGENPAVARSSFALASLKSILKPGTSPGKPGGDNTGIGTALPS